MQDKTKLLFFFSPELTLTQDTYCISFTGQTLIVLPWHLGGDGTVLGVNKWRRRVQYLRLAAVSACTGSGSYGTGSLALQTPSTADCKTVGVNLCPKTKHGGGDCSVSVFSPSVVFKEDGLNTVMFCFRGAEKRGKEAFSSRICPAMYLENMGDAACEWKKHQCQTEAA